jgi:hypothetical protein
MSARHALMEMINQPDCYGMAQERLVPMQIEAARELIAERRTQLPILERRIRETGTERIGKLDDLIPLLFSHTAFKSYPMSFVKNGQWNRLTQWLGTLTTRPMGQVNLDNVIDIDDWVSRLWDAGHLVNTTSGTSGKVSSLRHEPIFLTGGWSQLWDIMCLARSQGVGDGEFHTDTVIHSRAG